MHKKRLIRNYLSKLPIQARVALLCAIALIAMTLLGGQILLEKSKKTKSGELARVEQAVELALAIENLWTAFDTEKVSSNVLRPQSKYEATLATGTERQRQINEFNKAKAPTDKAIKNVQELIQNLDTSGFNDVVQNSLKNISKDISKEIPRIRKRWEASSDDFQVAYLDSEGVLYRLMSFASNIAAETSDHRLMKKLLAYGNYLQIAASYQKSFRIYDWGHDIGQLPPHAAIIAEQIIFRRKYLQNQLNILLEPEMLKELNEIYREDSFIRCATYEEEWRTKDGQLLYSFKPEIRSEWQRIGPKRFKISRDFVSILREDITNYKDKYVAETLKARNSAFAILFTGIGCALFLSVWITRSIKHTIQDVSGNLSQGAKGIMEAAHTVKQSGISLSGTVETQERDITNAINSIKSLTDGAEINQNKTDEASSAIARSSDTMRSSTEYLERLNESMQRIAENSNRTQKIIKTIDEIAFQTNILALNAAVEAARAGEAGAGFAVVAEEVRALAQRAAEAASDTTKLINESNRTVEEGKGICIQANSAFEKIAIETENIVNIVEQIDQATQGQKNDFEQLLNNSENLQYIASENAQSSQQNASSAECLTQQVENVNCQIKLLQRLAGIQSKNGYANVDEKIISPRLN